MPGQHRNTAIGTWLLMWMFFFNAKPGCNSRPLDRVSRSKTWGRTSRVQALSTRRRLLLETITPGRGLLFKRNKITRDDILKAVHGESELNISNGIQKQISEKVSQSEPARMSIEHAIEDARKRLHSFIITHNDYREFADAVHNSADRIVVQHLGTLPDGSQVLIVKGPKIVPLIVLAAELGIPSLDEDELIEQLDRILNPSGYSLSPEA